MLCLTNVAVVNPSYCGGSSKTSSQRLASISLRSHHMDFDIEWDFASASREKRNVRKSRDTTTIHDLKVFALMPVMNDFTMWNQSLRHARAMEGIHP
ncbi:hypothetical protein GW17_00027301 [Ensete ventricosum]|nr:hypothetical protein GW17_00027301 [Ensete ventricosum]